MYEDAIIAELERQQRQGFVEEKKGRGRRFSFEIITHEKAYSFAMDIKAPCHADAKAFVRDLAGIVGEGEIRYDDHTDHERMPLGQFLRDYNGKDAVSYWSDGYERGFDYCGGQLHMRLPFNGVEDLPVSKVKDVFSVLAGYAELQAVHR
ncbi:hypothetical protein HY642_07115 [Candidatus Woesearchaeota archaeon]|nr:hypothetical protein [Candidatus Woesearchaeota archaeon]